VRILVPYHLDEHLPDLDVPASADLTVTADLPSGDPWRRLLHLYEPVAAAVSTADRPAVLSGDCLVSLGVVAGLQRAGLDPGIVWFDAHGDVQTLETTSSGYLGGMPLRILAGYRPELIANGLGLRPVPEERIALSDGRDLDPPEASYLAGAAIRRLDVPAVAAATLPDGPLYLHVDLDVVDPADLGWLRYPAPGGPDLGTVLAALDRVIRTGRVAGLTLACTWYPGRDAAAGLQGPVEELLAQWS
jgi:arginase